jgi:hypothetical protein
MMHIPMTPRTRNICRLVVKPLVLLACALASLRTTIAPPPRAPFSQADFSVDRALDHVRAIAIEPHPAGSLANQQVRTYLLDHLKQLGLQTTVLTSQIRDHRGALRTVNNIEARLHGSAPEQGATIMLAAHYDSVPFGPGASDDTAAVAALLETLRALRAGPPLRQNLLLVITDGEELGLLGAVAYVQSHADDLKNNVALLLNFDARGTSGPSIMYENAPGNLQLIRHFAHASPNPIANSLAYDVSRLLPNSTDFVIYRRAGLKGLNFAFINHYYYYHTANDTIESLNPASLAHDGAYALSLTRHFANLSAADLAAINAPAQPDAVYFNLTPALLVRDSSTWIWPLSALAILAAGLALFLGFRQRRLTPKALTEAFARFLLALLLVPAAIYGLMSIVHPPQTPTAFTSLVTITIALSFLITWALASLKHRRTTPTHIAASGAILFAILMIPVNLYVPGASFLFAWPLLFLSIGLFISTRLNRSTPLLIAVLPTLWLWIPLIVMLFTALTWRLAPVCGVGVLLATWTSAAAIGRAATHIPDTPV